MTDLLYCPPLVSLATRSNPTTKALASVLVGLCVGALSSHAWGQDSKPVYRCPGNLYTDALAPKEAIARGCKTLDGAPITVIQSPVRAHSNAQASGASAANSKVSSEDQKARDADRRRILEAELRKEEEALANLQKNLANGQAERRGDESNFQKYLDRVSELKAAVTRKEADVAALRRELGAK